MRIFHYTFPHVASDLRCTCRTWTSFFYGLMLTALLKSNCPHLDVDIHFYKCPRVSRMTSVWIPLLGRLVIGSFVTDYNMPWHPSTEAIIPASRPSSCVKLMSKEADYPIRTCYNRTSECWKFPCRQFKSLLWAESYVCHVSNVPNAMCILLRCDVFLMCYHWKQTHYNAGSTENGHGLILMVESLKSVMCVRWKHDDVCSLLLVVVFSSFILCKLHQVFCLTAGV